MALSTLAHGLRAGQNDKNLFKHTLGDKLLSNFSRGGATSRGSFHAKVLVLFIKNGRLPLQLIKKITVEMQEDFLRKFCSCVCYLQK